MVGRGARFVMWLQRLSRVDLAKAHLDRYLNTMYLHHMFSLVEGKSFMALLNRKSKQAHLYWDKINRPFRYCLQLYVTSSYRLDMIDMMFLYVSNKKISRSCLYTHRSSTCCIAASPVQLLPPVQGLVAAISSQVYIYLAISCWSLNFVAKSCQAYLAHTVAACHIFCH
jgi:hypothetical protein